MAMNFTYEELESINDAYRLISNEMDDARDLIDKGDMAGEIKAHQVAVDAFVEFIENVLGRNRNDFLEVIDRPSMRHLFRDDLPEAILNYCFYNCAFVKVLEPIKSHQ